MVSPKKSPNLGEPKDFNPPINPITYPRSSYPSIKPRTDHLTDHQLNLKPPNSPPNLNDPPRTKVAFKSRKPSSDDSNQLGSRILDEIKYRRDHLKPVGPEQRTRKKPQNTLHSELTNTLKSLNPIQELEKKPYLNCQKCDYRIDWPTHCFKKMVTKSDTLSCTTCQHSIPVYRHCGVPMAKLFEEDVATNLMSLGDRYQDEQIFEKAIDFYKNALRDLEGERIHLPLIGRSKLELGYCYLSLGNLGVSHEYLIDAIEIFEALGLVGHLGHAYYYIALNSIEQGQINEAEKQLERSRILIEETDNLKTISEIYITLGKIYRLRGKYSQVERIFNKANDILHELGDSSKNIDIYLNSAIIDRELGNYEYAISDLRFAIEIAKENEYFIKEAIGRSILIGILVEMADHTTARQELIDLQRLALSHPNVQTVQFRTEFAEALILKASPRMIDKAKSLQTFYNLHEMKDIGYEQSLSVMVNIADLLIQELQAFEQEEVLDEVSQIIERLSKNAEEMGSASMYIQSALLRIKIEGVKGNFVEADGLIQQLEHYINENNLPIERNQLTRMREDFEKEIKRIDHLNHVNQPLKKRIEKSQISLYIQKALKMVEID